MSKIYVPEFNSGNCVYIQNGETLRVYESQPRQNSTINYKDYYIKSSYLMKEGSQTFSNMSTLPSCVSSNNITTDYVYRQDFPEILIVSFGLIFMGYFFVSKIVRTVFIDWRYS